MSKVIIFNGDDNNTIKSVQGITGKEKITFGSDATNTYYYKNLEWVHGAFAKFTVFKDGEELGEIELNIPGEHNILNALCAVATGMYCGVTFKQCKESLYNFKGAGRRFEILGEYNGAVIVDDYAHHPEEIKACIESIRSLYPDKRICGIFQPHLYSRTKDFANEFAESLSKLDDVIVLDIYPARELPIKGVTSNLIHRKIKGKKSVLCKKEDCLNELKLHKFDVLITIGAGNIDQLVNPITEYLNTL